MPTFRRGPMGPVIRDDELDQPEFRERAVTPSRRMVREGELEAFGFTTSPVREGELEVVGTVKKPWSAAGEEKAIVPSRETASRIHGALKDALRRQLEAEAETLGDIGPMAIHGSSGVSVG